MPALQLPELSQSLYHVDLGHLQIVARAWDLELTARDARSGLQDLLVHLLNPQRLQRVIEQLPEDARVAFWDLLDHDGCLSWALFTRRHGALREFGPARRDRERPYLAPASPTEVLWYRGLLGRSFLNTPDGPQEFAYIPKDFLTLLPEIAPKKLREFGRLASAQEQSNTFPAGDLILDDACTVLAALRNAIDPEPFLLGQGPVSEFASAYRRFLEELLSAAGLIDPAGMPLPEPVRSFLERERREALASLVQAWLNHPLLNELFLLPDLVMEGEIRNNPLETRRICLDFASSAPSQRIKLSGDATPAQAGPAESSRPFVSLASFIAAIRQHHPDFQRLAGDYDSWFIRQRASGLYLRGFEHWDQVEGALIRFILCGPLHWLGLVDLASEDSDSADPDFHYTAFRFSRLSPALLHGQAPTHTLLETERWLTRSDGRILVPRLSSRSARYQIARFCNWEKVDRAGYHFRLSPASLERARKQGLKISHLLALLRKMAELTPPNIVRALERWEERSLEVVVEKVIVLRVKDPEILQALRASRAARYLGDPLGSTAILVKPGAVDALLNALIEMGFLGEILE
ncbi:MAG: helicase-associated domain-containing protein [Anaerolineales bacterium]|nr:helicase-associated domain-containing protein [Anaerolineales bacterium]